MKVWVMGSTGMLGSYFVRLLEARKLDFVSHKVDIRSLNEIRQFVESQQITHIINCAAYTQVDKAESDKEMAYQVNAVGPENLGKISRGYGCHITHFSTDYVFDGLDAAPYTEECVCSPTNYYGETKLAGEKMLLDQTDNACIIRTSWLYGYPGKNFVETMVRLMKEKELLRVVNDQKGCPTYCKDLAEASLFMLDKKGIFHFANSHETTWFRFAKEIYRQCMENGVQLKVKEIIPITTQEYPTPAKRPAHSVLNTNKMAKVLGGNPRPWQEALKDYLNNYNKG